MHAPITYGEHHIGDGIKMAEAIGGESIDIDGFKCTRLG